MNAILWPKRADPVKPTKRKESALIYFTDVQLHYSERCISCAVMSTLYPYTCRGRKTRTGFIPCREPAACPRHADTP